MEFVMKKPINVNATVLWKKKQYLKVKCGPVWVAKKEHVLLAVRRMVAGVIKKMEFGTQIYIYIYIYIYIFIYFSYSNLF